MKARIGTALAAVAMGILLTGCSQVSALAPVGGDALRTVSIATNDVLLEQGYSVAVVPVCTQSGTSATCAGTTTDGRDIAVTAELKPVVSMTVSVAGVQVYSGSAQEIIDRAAQP